jgi:segregation and condensation protein B
MSAEPNPEPTPQEVGESLAARIGNQDWVLDEEDLLTAEGGVPIAEPVVSDPVAPPATEVAVPVAEAAVEAEVPPTPLQIIEAMLFVGGQPLKAEKACAIVRGLGIEQVREAIELLNQVYRLQNRPYFIASSEQGYSLTVRPRYKSIKEKIFGGPREARLTQAALDVLSLAAYRQPTTKNEIDTIRGVDSGHLVRQLVRLGLIAVVQRAEAKEREVRYGTTSRFLELFNLKSLDDLPQTGDPQRL